MLVVDGWKETRQRTEKERTKRDQQVDLAGIDDDGAGGRMEARYFDIGFLARFLPFISVARYPRSRRSGGYL